MIKHFISKMVVIALLIDTRIFISLLYLLTGSELNITVGKFRQRSYIYYCKSHTRTDVSIGKLHISIGRLDYDLPYRIKIYWNRGAGYIGGFTIHIRLQPLTAYCKHQYKYLRKAYLTPIIGITTNGNKWVI